MPFRFNPVTATLEIVSPPTGGGGGGNVTGIAPTTLTAIARWADTGASIIENSEATIQDSGAVVAQGYITQRLVVGDVLVKNNQSWIAPSGLSIETDGSIELEVDAELIVV